MARPHCVLLLLVGAFTVSAGHDGGVNAATGENRRWREDDAARASGPAEPLVDLAWEPVSDWAYVGQVFEVQLIARTDTAEDQTIAAIDMVFQWDAAYLKLLGVDNNGPYGWLSSGFPNDSGQDGLNNTFLDGDAFYQAWSSFGAFAVATPQGLHVTTFLFEALQGVENVQVSIEEILLSTESHVHGGDFLGQDVTGQLGTVSLRVCSGASGDDDGDGIENCPDLCPGTPPGETVNADGCGCSQLACDDGQFCNGAEGCANGVCQPGEPPTCNDGVDCTADWCDPAANEGAGVCVNEPELGGTPCGDPTDTECDDPDSCDGAGTCLSNYVSAGAPCGDPTDTICDNPDSCDGNGTCLDNYEPTTTECRVDAGECDVPEYCDGAGACPVDAFEPVDTPCGDPADMICDNPDTCDGSGACLDNHEPDGTVCTDEGNDCTGDLCGTGVCTHPNLDAGTACGDPTDTECDDPDTCDGTGTCLFNYVVAGTACGDPADDDCTGPDTCNGDGACLSNHEPVGTPCPDKLFCNGEETCDGAGTCQPGTEPCSEPLLPFCDEDINECVECLRIGDVNGDGEIDLQDFGDFPGCMTGPIDPADSPGYPDHCRCLDADDDGDVDILDYATFQRRFRGP